MLYDRRKEHGTLPHLISWLESKPANEKYDYTDPCRCLAAQYKADIGQEYDCIRSIMRIWCGGKDFDIQLENIAHAKNARRDWTYGAALKRARALMTEQ